MINQAEIERIKQSVDIRELASSYVALQGSHEMSGPCPKCGGEDRFHCKAGWFFCRQCHPNRGDAIEFVMWLEGCSFLEACDKLTTGDGFSIPPQPRKPAGKVRSIWTSEQWQKSANREVEQAVHAMNGPSGEQGRRYLEGRAIVDTTWKAWRLGYVPRVERRYQVDSEWHRDDLGPAISMVDGFVKTRKCPFIR